MVRRYGKNGFPWDEPPYTKEEERDFYRRIGGGPVTIVHRPAQPVDEATQPKRQKPPPRPPAK